MRDGCFEIITFYAKQFQHSSKEIVMAHEILELKSVHPTKGYSHAAKAGNTLYIAGQIAKDVDGNIVGRSDFEIQARQVHENLKNILKEAGGSLHHIVKMTIFLTHYSYIDTYRRIRDEYFPEPGPPNTLLVVESLALPDYLIEVEAVAYLG